MCFKIFDIENLAKMSQNWKNNPARSLPFTEFSARLGCTLRNLKDSLSMFLLNAISAQGVGRRIHTPLHPHMNPKTPQPKGFTKLQDCNQILLNTSGCPWPKATVKPPVWNPGPKIEIPHPENHILKVFRFRSWKPRVWKSRPQSWDPKSWKPCPENHILKFPRSFCLPCPALPCL
jgi:hypothetical protein